VSGGLSRLSRATADAVRELTRVTARGDGYRTPADTDALIGDLTAMVYDLPQLLDQTARWLDAQHRAGRIGHDTHPHPHHAVHEAVGEAVGDLERAGREALELARTLDAVRENTSHLTAVTSTTSSATGRSGGGGR